MSQSIWLSLCLLAVFGLQGNVVKCTAAIYTQRCYCTGMSITKYMAFSIPTGCVRFARYCGKMYSRHLYTTLLLYRDEYHKSIWLSLCLPAVFGLQGIVVKCTAAIYTQRCYCTGMNIVRVYGFLYVYRLCSVCKVLW